MKKNELVYSVLKEIYNNMEKQAKEYECSKEYSFATIYRYKKLIKENKGKYKTFEDFMQGFVLIEKKSYARKEKQRIDKFEEILNGVFETDTITEQTLYKYKKTVEDNPGKSAKELNEIYKDKIKKENKKKKKNYYKKEKEIKKYKVVKCLKCKKPFESELDKREIPYFRLCDSCKEENKKIRTFNVTLRSY